jgi:hypothetical protein
MVTCNCLGNLYLQNTSLSVECEFCAWKEKADSTEQHKSKSVGGWGRGL